MRRASQTNASVESLESRRVLTISYNATTDELVIYGGMGNDTINVFGVDSYDSKDLGGFWFPF